VDDQPNICRVLEAFFSKHGWEVSTFASPKEALEAITAPGADSADVVVTDLVMPGMNGLEFIRELRAHGHTLPVLVVTAHGTIGTTVEAMRLGAVDYVSKPFDLDNLKAAAERAVAIHRPPASTNEHAGPDASRAGTVNIVGKSRPMQDVFRLIEKAAASRANVLIRGESGTGKELVARALHFLSPRANRKFVPVSCPVFSKDLLESELFGHEKGSFTGALYQKAGRFEVADGGTLFLDEIGDIALDTQVKLLRVMQEREFERVGGTKSIKVDVRMVTATNKDLEAAVRNGDFREDLYYRLNVIEIVLPPLRARRDDIPLLVEHFLHKYSAESSRPTMAIDRAALEILTAYQWPGNVRELENTIEHAVAMADRDVTTVTPGLLPTHIRMGRPLGFRDPEPTPPAPDPEPSDGSGPFAEEVAKKERELLLKALTQTDWNLTRAAEILGISFRSMRYNVKKHGLTRAGHNGAPQK